MKCGLYGMIILMLMVAPDICMADQNTNKSCDCVILLHGLARTKTSLSTLETHLKKDGFKVINQAYPSRKDIIEKLSDKAIPDALEECRKFNPGKIHFATHSMGGILVRYYLDHHTIPNLGRVVMISPPNNGSEVVDKLRKWKLYQWLNGPAGNQLGTGNDSILRRIGRPYYETGIITGDRTINPFLSLIIPGKDDGKVSVQSAKLNGMQDFLIMHNSHTFIMNDKNVCRQVSFFLKTGKFNTPSSSSFCNLKK